VNKFNLTFSGEILADHDPARVKLRFGKMFAIDDPVRLERFFSGQTIILRRNLERKAAAQYYHELHLIGLVATLVKVTASESAGVDAKVSPSRQKSPDIARHDKTDIAAQLSARKAESLQRAAAKDARDKAILAQHIQQQEDETAQREAAAIEARRAAAEASARIEAERARQKAENAARLRAKLEEQIRREAEQAARRQAQLEEQKRLEAEQAARRLAELEEKKRQQAEEAARLQAELEEIKRQQAEEAARLQAELEEIKRQEAEEAARIAAEAQRKKAEAQRESAERRRAAAEKIAAQRALRREEKRKAAVRQAEQKAEAAARLKAEQLHKEEQERLEQTAISTALQEQVVQRAIVELAHQAAFKPTKARIKTRMEVPQRKTGQPVEVGTPGQRKRQSGEPNLYTLRPFRNTEHVRARAAQAHQRMRLSYALGALALVALLLVGGSFFRRVADPVITGAHAVAVDPRSGPLLLAGNVLLLHDRAGVSTKQVPLSTLGVSQLEPPLAFDSAGALLALGRLTSDSADPTSGNTLQLLRCELAVSTCQRVSQDLNDNSIGTFVIHPLDGSLLLVDTAAGQLLKINRAGKIVARASVPIPEHPVLRLHGGLLLLNSADGPALSVLRYEDSAFGQQLDEVLLLPPAAQEADQSRVGDFVWSGGSWWVSLQNPTTGSVGVYRFDSEWNYIDAVALPVDAISLQLVSWDEKTLVNDPRHPAFQRFSAKGTVEAPFVSPQLADLVAQRQRGASLTSAAWRGGLLLCALTAALGFGFGYLQHLRTLVYKARRGHGAEPVEGYVNTLQWIDPVADRPALLRSRGFNYGLLVIGVLLLAIGQSVTAWQLAALLFALSGPAIALLLLKRRSIGHIGIVQDRLLLVDHSGMYHLASGSSVQYCGPFLMIDDVVVFCGSRLLPAFSAAQIQKLVRPLALGGVKVDRNTVLVKLLQGRHPLAQGACAIAAAASAAAMLLCLYGIF
jgi:hypothetical protein